MTSRPNLLLITTDQQRWDAVGANDNPAIRTPYLDRLARDGANFRNGFCAAAACMPSRACILTGVHPHVHGVMHTAGKTWVRDDLPTLPGLLSAHGYHSVGVGKMHFQPWDAMCGFDRRVIIETKYFGDMDEYRVHVQERGIHDKVIGHHVPGFGKANKAMRCSLDEADHIDGFTGRRGVETLKELVTGPRTKPFFMWWSFCGPHDPYDPTEPYASMYDPANIPLPIRADREHDRLPPCVRENATACGIEKMNLWGIPDREIQRMRALYYGNVTLIDACIGRALDLLRSSGLEEETLIVFTSDHADFLGDHDLIWKTGLPTDADMRVPLILRWPGKIATGRPSALASGLDLMPTFLSAAGVNVPGHCPGSDLVGALRQNRPTRDHVILYSEPNKWRYRDAGWAYTWWPDQPFDTLYDLKNDPNELNNLCYGCATPPEPARRLKKVIQDYLKETL